MSVRDYAAFLQLNCSGMDSAVCERFVSAYEAARFARDDVSLAAYLVFRETFVALIESLDSAVLTPHHSCVFRHLTQFEFLDFAC